MRLRTTLAPASASLLLLVAAACGGGGGDDDGVATLGEGDGGGATTETTLSEEEAEEAMLDWVACMREEGVDLPDPETDGEGNTRFGVVVGGPEGDEDQDGGGPGGSPNVDELEAAEEACGPPPSFGGEFSEEDRAEMEAQALAFAECMREQGLEDFPDPDFSEMGPGAGPSVRIIGGERASGSPDDDADDDEPQGPFGDIDPSTPEFQAAQAACAEELGDGAPRFEAGGPGSGGGGRVDASEAGADG